MEIGKQIKKYRAEMNFSQEELAEKIFVSRQTISNWENNKNYPDVKSLVLLSSLFDVSLDILVKGDLDEMKEKINREDIVIFKHYGKVYTLLLACTILSPIPLIEFLGNVGFGIWGGIAVITVYFSVRIEKYKKKFNIQTYREIVEFMDGKSIEEIEKDREFGKRPYQKCLLGIGAILITLVFTVIMGYIFL